MLEHQPRTAPSLLADPTDLTQHQPEQAESCGSDDAAHGEILTPSRVDCRREDARFIAREAKDR